jgi:hypothetical protein
MEMMASLTLRPEFPRGICPSPNPLNRRPIWTVRERKTILLLPGIEPQFFDCLDGSFLKPEIYVSDIEM